MKEALGDANFPKTAEGRVYHVGVKPGEVANRILTVGDHVRARRIAGHFDGPAFERVSQRGFTTLTGRYKGVPVTVIAIGMGYPMIDFFVRETRAVVQGQMVIIRFGSCGTLVPEVPVGALVVAKSAVFVGTNFDFFHAPTEGAEPYWISKPIDGDVKLHDDLTEAMKVNAPKGTLVQGGVLHAAADSFYASQGRLDSSFPDANEKLIDQLKAKYPGMTTLEMESTHLFHLAAISTRAAQSVATTSHIRGGIRAAAAHMTFAGRVAGDFITPETVELLENAAGKACLDTLVQQKIDTDLEHPEEGSVWAKV